MPDEIKFAFVQSDNLKRKFFQVPQAIVAIAVEGAEDPLTHQRMRDAVEDQFTTTQKKINEFIKQRDLQISKLGVNERKRNKTKLIEAGNQTIEKHLADFKREAESELTDFTRREKETASKVQLAEGSETWRNVRWLVSVSWTGVKAIGGLVSVVSSGGLTTPLVVKEFVDNLVDLQKLVSDLVDHYADVKQTRARVRQGLTTLKNKSKLTNSDVEAFANEVKLYEGKILSLEVKARAISSKLNASLQALQAMPKQGVKPEAIEKAEKALDESLKELVSLSVSIKAAQKYLTTTKKNLGAARAQAKSDPTLTTVKNWVIEAYSKVNDLKDVVLDPTALYNWLDVTIKFFGDTKNVLEG
jgi:hypothetical protein